MSSKLARHFTEVNKNDWRHKIFPLGIVGVDMVDCINRKFGCPRLCYPKFIWNTSVRNHQTRLVMASRCKRKNNHCLPYPQPHIVLALCLQIFSFQLSDDVIDRSIIPI